MKKGYKEAVKRIEEVRENHLFKLELNDFDLDVIPKEVFELEHLRELFLGVNNLTEIPDEISNLKKLRSLYLHRNKIHSSQIQ